MYIDDLARENDVSVIVEKGLTILNRSDAKNMTFVTSFNGPDQMEITKKANIRFQVDKVINTEPQNCSISSEDSRQDNKKYISDFVEKDVDNVGKIKRKEKDDFGNNCVKSVDESNRIEITKKYSFTVWMFD